MRIAGLENVYYVDTDSLWTSAKGYEALVAANAVSPGKLGSLRVVDVHRWVEFRGIKYYETPAGITCAGVPTGDAAVKLDDYSYWLPETMLVALKAKRAPAERFIRYNMSYRRPYKHGVVLADGSVIPWEVCRE